MKISAFADGTTVKVSKHKSLNSCRVVIACRDIIDEDENIILEELKSQGVISVTRIMRKRGDKLEKKAIANNKN